MKHEIRKSPVTHSLSFFILMKKKKRRISQSWINFVARLGTDGMKSYTVQALNKNSGLHPLSKTGIGRGRDILGIGVRYSTLKQL